MLYMKTALNSGFLFSAREKLEKKNHFQKKSSSSRFLKLSENTVLLVTENMITVISQHRTMT